MKEIKESFMFQFSFRSAHADERRNEEEHEGRWSERGLERERYEFRQRDPISTLWRFSLTLGIYRSVKAFKEVEWASPARSTRESMSTAE